MHGIGGPMASPGGRFAQFAQANPEQAAQRRALHQERMAQWQAENPGATMQDFHAERKTRMSERIKGDFAQWQASNAGGTVEQFAEAKHAERRAALEARGIQLPQAMQGTDLLSRITDRIRSVLGS